MPRLSAPLPALLAITVALCLLAAAAQAQWPTTIRENLPLPADPALWEAEPFAFPYPEGRTLVVEKIWGYQYQIVDRYGNWQFPEFQPVCPTLTSYNVNWMQAIEDGQGGVIVCWTNSVPAGTYAQKIDSQGSLCWGDSAAVVVPLTFPNWNIGPDGMGGSS